MKKIFSSQPFEASYEDYKKTIEWLRSLGLRLTSSRVEEYAEIHSKLLEMYRNEEYEEAKQWLPKIFNALYEINNLSSIHRNMGGKYDDQIRKKLASIIKGTTSSTLETEKNILPRNTQFELYLASKFAEASHDLIFDGTTDVKLVYAGTTLHFECKRLQTKKKIERNIKKARKQLDKLYKNRGSINYRGIIAIDISKIVNPDNDLLVKDSEVEIDRALSTIIDDFIYNNQDIWQRSKWNKKTIGILIRYSMMGVINNKNEMMTYCHQSGFNPIKRAGEQNFNLLRDFASTL